MEQKFKYFGENREQLMGPYILSSPVDVTIPLYVAVQGHSEPADFFGSLSNALSKHNGKDNMKTNKQKKSTSSPKPATNNRAIKKGDPPGQDRARNKSKRQTRVNYVVNPRKLKFLTNKRATEEKRQLIQEDKQRRFKEIDQKKSEKVQRNRQFNKKTKRGQPVMKNQIEFLLKKIQTNLSQD